MCALVPVDMFQFILESASTAGEDWSFPPGPVVDEGEFDHHAEHETHTRTHPYVDSFHIRHLSK